MTEIIKAAFQNDFIKDEPEKILNTFNIGFIMAKRDINYKTKEVRIKSFILALQYKKTGFLAPSKVIEIQWNSPSRKAFELCLKTIQTDEWLSQDFYSKYSNSGYISTLYVPRNPEIKIQNKLKLGFDITRRIIKDIEGLEENSFKQCFEFTFKNFSDYPMYILATNDISFFNYFENREIKTPAILFEKEIEKSFDIVNRALKDTMKRVDQENERLKEQTKDLIQLQLYKEKAPEVRQKIYALFSQEEIDSQRLLKEMKKFGGGN